MGARQDVAAGEQLAQTAERREPLLDREVEEARRQPDRRHPVARHRCVKVGQRVRPGRQERQTAAVEERPPDLEGRQVERHRHQLEEDFAGTIRRVAHLAHQPHHRTMADLDPLGRARRAGGVEHVGEGRRRHVCAPEDGGCGVRLGVLEGGVLERQVGHPIGDIGESRQQAPRPHHGRRRGVRQQQLQPLARVGGVERQVGGARLEGAQERDDQLRRALGADGDPRLETRSQPPQPPRDAAGAPVELAVGERAALPDDGRRVGPHRRLLLEQAVHAPEGEARRRVVPLCDELVALGRGEERQGGERQLRRCRRCCRPGDERSVVAEEARRGRRGEEVRRVLQDQGELRLVSLDRHLHRREQEVELRRRPLAPGEPHEAQPRGVTRRARRGLAGSLEGEEHLDQRVPRPLALRPQLLDQHVERQVLMGEGGERRVAHRREQAAEGRIAGRPRPDHHRVDEEPDQALDLRPRAVGDRRADEQVLLSRDAREERREAGEEQHVERRPLPPCRLAERRSRQAEHGARAAEARRRRALPVDRQRQRRGCPRELIAPVGELPPEHLRRPGALPGGEVGILHPELAERRRAPREGRRVERRELGDQHLLGPAVVDDVVHGEEERVLLLVQAHQAGAQQGAAGEAERPARLLGAQARELAEAPLPPEGAQVDLRQRHPPGGADLLPGLAVHLDEPGAQRLVPADDLGEAGGERRRSERPGDEPGRRDVVERALRRQAVEEPEPLLGEGEQRRRPLPLGIRERRERRQGALRPPPRRGDHTRLRGQGGEREERLRAELHPERLADARQQAHDGERMPAQVEEVVVGADPPAALEGAPLERQGAVGGRPALRLGVEHLLPESGEHLHDQVAQVAQVGRFAGAGTLRRTRLARRRSVRLGCQQRPPVELADVGERQRRERHEGGGHHVPRQARAQEGAQVLLARLGARLRHVVRHHAVVAAALGEAHDRRFAHLRVEQEGGLDLAGLDAEAAHLDLEVVPPEEREGAVGAPPHQVAGLVEPRFLERVGLERVGEEALGRQLAAVEIAAREPRAGEVELAGAAHRHGRERRVEHVGAAGRDGPADGDRSLGQRVAHPVGGREDGVLGRSVAVDQLDLRQRRDRLLQVGARHDVAAGQQRAQPRESRQALLDGDVEEPGGQKERRHPVALHLLVEVAEREGPGRRQRHAAAIGERPPELERRGVEGQERHLEEDVPGAEGEVSRLAHQPHHRLVGHFDAVGRPGRARSVEDVRQVFRRHVGRELFLRRGGCLGRRRRVLSGRPRQRHHHGPRVAAGRAVDAGQPIDQRLRRLVGGEAGAEPLGEVPGRRRMDGEEVDRELRRLAGQRRQRAARADDRRRRRILQQEMQTLPRIGELDRQVGAARLENAQDRRHHLRRALQVEGHARLRPHSQPPQPAGDAARLPVELAIAERPSVPDHRHRVRPRRRLLLEELVERAAREGGRRVVPLGEHLVALGLAEKRQARERQIRRRRGAGQERRVVLEEARRGRSVEEVDGVVEREEELRLPPSTLDLADGEGEVHRELPLAGGEARRAFGGSGIRPGKNHLKRQIGLGECRREGAIRCHHQMLKGRIAGPQHAQRQEARARPFLSFLGRREAGGPDDEILGAAVARQEGGEAGEEEQVERGLLSPHRLPQARRQSRRQAQLAGRAAQARDGRARPVRRQFEAARRLDSRGLGEPHRAGHFTAHKRAAHELASGACGTKASERSIQERRRSAKPATAGGTSIESWFAAIS